MACDGHYLILKCAQFGNRAAAAFRIRAPCNEEALVVAFLAKPVTKPVWAEWLSKLRREESRFASPMKTFGGKSTRILSRAGAIDLSASQ
jgi:hypothetical protein